MHTRGMLLSVRKQYKNPTKRVGLVQSEHHYHPIQFNLFLP